MHPTAPGGSRSCCHPCSENLLGAVEVDPAFQSMHPKSLCGPREMCETQGLGKIGSFTTLITPCILLYGG